MRDDFDRWLAVPEFVLKEKLRQEIYDASGKLTFNEKVLNGEP